MAHSPSRSGRPPIQQLQTVAALLDTPALARLYAHILQHGPVIVSEIVDTLDIPQETVYDYVQNLEIADPVEKFREQRPYEYDTEAIALTLSTDGETQAITLPLSRLLPAAMRTRSSMSISSGMALTASLPPLSTPTSTSAVQSIIESRLGNLISHRLSRNHPAGAGASRR